MADVFVMDRPTPPSPRRARRSARAGLLWGALALVVGHVALIGYADTCAPGVYDPEYAARLARLRARRAEQPDRPLLVVLGSSRTCQLFRPEVMSPLTTAEGREVLPFNFSRVGGGPVYSRFAYARLRQQNLKPDWVVVELMPLMFIKDAERYFYPGVTASEFGDLCTYISDRRAVGFYAKYRFVPWRANRVGLVRGYAPVWTVPFVKDEPNDIDSLGGEGRRIIAAMSDAEREATHARVAAGYGPALANYRIDPGADRAFRDLLRECRGAGTKVVVVRTPESTSLRAAYPAHARATLAAYQSELVREFGVTVIDAGVWLPDNEFSDGHHPLLAGQARFTERLHREVLTPLVAGRIDSAPGSAAVAK